MEDKRQEPFDWPIGEVPAVTPEELQRGALSHFYHRVQNMRRSTSSSHEVVTSHGGKVEDKPHHLARNLAIAGVGIAVVSILAARHNTRVRPKKKN